MKAPRRLAALLICVLSFGGLAAQTTFTWTGTSATKNSYGTTIADASDSANWGGTLPTSSSTGTLLAFNGSAGLNSYGYIHITLPYRFETAGLIFGAGMPTYSFAASDGGRLDLGANGITINPGSGNYSYVSVDYSTRVRLLADQTWRTENDLYVFGRIEDPTSFTTAPLLTKTGAGSLYLHNVSNSFTGGLDIQAGSLYVGGSASASGSPVGTGTLTLRDNTTLGSYNWGGDITLANNLRIGTGVTLGHEWEKGSLVLNGAVTPLNTSTTLFIGTDGATFFGGTLSNASGGATQFTFQRPTDAATDFWPIAVLNAANTYTGGTIADGAGVIFLVSGSLPATGNVSAVNNGYISTGYNGGMADLLSKIATPSTFDGSLGFDTNTDVTSTPTTFSDAIDLSAFSSDHNVFRGLGSRTAATITGMITPPSGGTYVFGGREGKLYVESNLTQPVGVRVQTTSGENPLTVWLRGNNSYAGALLSDHSIVVLDSANALPAVGENGSGKFQLDSLAYVGYTERFTGGTSTTLTPAEFIARLNTPNYNSDSILGFDSYDSNGRTISAPVNLSSLNDIFIGSSTHAHLAGTLTAPSGSGRLSVTGVNGGWLTLDTALTSAAVTSLNVGAVGTESHEKGIVELGTGSGSSNFTGGTTFNSGYLLVNESSSRPSSTITSGPLGTGVLTVSNSSYHLTPTLIAGASNVTLHNDINLGYGGLQIGVPVVNDDEHPAYHLQSYAYTNLTLAGALSASTISSIATSDTNYSNGYHTLRFMGNGTTTLSGDNSGLSGYYVQIGTYNYDDDDDEVSAKPLVVAASNSALGSTSNSIHLAEGADLQFTTSAPTVGSLSGGDRAYYGEVYDDSYITLADGSTLTITQNSDNTLHARIGGAPNDRFTTGSLGSTTAAIVKAGTGTLTLKGASTYTGGTTVSAGTLVVADAAAVGTGSVTLAGGRLEVASGVTFGNTVVFTGTGNLISGNGTFSSPLTVGTGVTLAPGNSPGIITFTNGLTWAAGGVFKVEISDMSGSAGSGYDSISLTGGALTVSATSADRFSIEITSLNSSGTNGLLGPTPTQPYSMTILSSSSSLAGVFGTNFEKLNLNTANFTSNAGADFTLSLGNEGTSLLLNFTPVPEPSTYVLFGLGLLLVAGSVWRTRRARRD